MILTTHGKKENDSTAAAKIATTAENFPPGNRAERDVPAPPQRRGDLLAE